MRCAEGVLLEEELTAAKNGYQFAKFVGKFVEEKEAEMRAAAAAVIDHTEFCKVCQTTIR